MPADGEVTTIQVYVSTLKKLARYRDPVFHKNWSQPIEDLLDLQGDVYVDVVAVDGKLAKTTDHEVLVQLGDEPPRFYYYHQGRFAPLALSQVELLDEEMRTSILKSPQFIASR